MKHKIVCSYNVCLSLIKNTLLHCRMAEILYSLTVARGATLESVSARPLLSTSRRNLGLFQHHDGITGTAKDRVVDDYATRSVILLLNYVCVRMLEKLGGI